MFKSGRIALLAVPTLWSPLVYGLVYFGTRNSQPPLTPRFLLDPVVVFTLVFAGVAGYIASDMYWAPVVPAIVEATAVVLLPVAMAGVSEIGPIVTLYSLVSFYWLAVAITCFYIAKRIPQRDVFQKRFPGAFDGWDEDDD